MEDKRCAVARWITLLWPGLTQLWLSGAWWGLAIGCSFAWLMNLAILSTWDWTELVSPTVRMGVWVLLGMVWLASMILSFRQLLGFAPANAAEKVEALFRRAGREYLRGNWIEAERLLGQVIQLNRHDVDARLMLASLLRRTGQTAEAAQCLRHLEAIDGAEKWRCEIERERNLLHEQLHPQQSTIDTQDNNRDQQQSANQAA